jgi:Family of unknown function (DUF6345)
MRYSTGCVRDYVPNGCGGPDLPLTIPEGQNFRFWYNFAGHQNVTRWDNGDVWGSDFRDGPGSDLDPSGGSELPQIYFYSGHGTCQNPPVATSPDFIVVCGNFGKPDRTTIGTQSRWGSATGGNLQFAFIDASCPMDLVSLGNQWFPAFRGLHMAVGHSGTSTADTLDSADRGSQFAAHTIGFFWLFPQLSVGDAWMLDGIIDIQNGCCAVAIAAGNDRNDAIDRRENERITDNRPDPAPNWFAWKWMCA